MADVKQTWGGDVSQLEKEVAKLIKQQIKLEEQIAKVGKTSQAASKKSIDDTGQQSSVFDTVIGKLARVAAGWASITTFTNLAKNAAAEYAAEREKGQGETARLENTRRMLLQVSEGDMADLMKRSSEGAKTYGIKREIAEEALFQARSAEFEPEYERILATDPLLDVKSQTMIAGRVRLAFGKQYTPSQIMAGAYKASAMSVLDFAPMAQELPSAVEGSKGGEGTPEEIMAALSVFASSTNEPGRRFRDLNIKMSQDKRTKGKGVVGGLEIIQGMSEKERADFLGRDMGKLAAYDIFTRDLEEIKRQRDLIKRDMDNPYGPGSAIGARIKEFYSIPDLADFKESQKAEEERKESAENAYTSVESRNKRFMDKLSTLRNEGKISGSEYTGARLEYGFRAWTGQDVEKFGRDMNITQGPETALTKTLDAIDEQKTTNELLRDISAKLDSQPDNRGAPQRNLQGEPR